MLKFTKLLKANLLFCLFALGAMKNSNAQTTLSAGDIAFTLVNSTDNTVNSAVSNDNFSFVLLKDITSGTQINFTDFGWCSDINGFQSILPCGANSGAVLDGSLTWTATSNLNYGTVINVVCKQSISVNIGSVSGTIANYNNANWYVNITVSDQIFAYQGAKASPTLIAGINSRNGWDNTLTNCLYTSSYSVLPTALNTNNYAATWPANSNNGKLKTSITLTGNKLTDLATIYNFNNWDFNSTTAFPFYTGSIAPVTCTNTSSTTTQSSCNSYVWNGVTYMQSGSYTKTGLTNAGGCDSTATLNLTIKNPTSSTTMQSACDSYIWNGSNYTTSGVYTFNTTNAAGCDSTATLKLTINKSTIATVYKTICPTDFPYIWAGEIRFNGPGSKTAHFPAACDSVITLVLSVSQATSTTNVSICSSQLPYIWNGLTINAAGTYTKTGFTNITGCDSSATLNLSVKNATASTTTKSGCDSLTWNGITYTASGTYVIHLNNAAGCDSVATLNLTIKKSTIATVYRTICSNEFPYIWGELRFNGPGSKTAYFPGSCDSIITLVISVKQASSSTTNMSMCSTQLPYSWNGLTFTSAGTQTAHLTNAAGCDSAATLNLSVKQASSSSTSKSYCQSELPVTWNGLTITSEGTYIAHLTNKAGCDSAAILMVMVKPGPYYNQVAGTLANMTTYTFCKLGDSVRILNYSGSDGVWSTSDANVAGIKPIPNTYNRSCWVYARTPGTATITHAVTVNGGCPGFAYSVITIDPAATPNVIIGSSNLCVGSASTYTNSTAGGEWSSANSKISINGSTGVAQANSAGACSIGYTVTNASGCSASVSLAATVIAVPAVPNISYAPGNVTNPQAGATAGSMCRNRTFSVSGSPVGGMWSGGGMINVSSSGVVTTGSSTGAGSISYVVTGSNNCSSTKTVNFNVVVCANRSTGNSQQSADNSFTVYPNPAHNVINVQAARLTGGTIVVTDLYGRQVKQQPIGLTANTIDVTNFARGVYFVSIVTEQGKQTQKVVVE